MIKRIFYVIALLSLGYSQGQSKEDETVLKTIYTQSLTNGKSYDWLNHLSNQIGSRLSGSLGGRKSSCLHQRRTGKSWFR